MGINVKNKTFWTMLFIVTIGTILRVIFINKPDGLWNDEYVSWHIASIPFGKTFWQAVFAQCHMPFYYLYLKFFIHFFGNSDLMLRLTSIPAGVLSIISMYFVGKELKDEKTGILSALLTSISAFLIYFSQEVRFYEILFFFASLALLFTMKLIKSQKLSNLIWFIVFNFLIIFTHTIGFIFVFLNLIFVSLQLSKDGLHKKTITVIWLYILILSIICSPLLFKILTAPSPSQWWGNFTSAKLGFLITDYFSPFLTNIVSSPDNFFYNFDLFFIIFALIPSIIIVTAIVKAMLSKKEGLWGLFFVSMGFVLTLIISSLLGKTVFITKYSIEIYPTLILIAAYGFNEFKEKIRYFLIFSICFLNLIYLFRSPVAAPKIRRSEGHKIVADLIKNAKLNEKDYILINYYPKDRFEKYFDFNKYNAISITKGNYPEYLGINTKEDLLNINKNYLNQKLNNEIIKKMHPGQKFVMIFLNDVSMYSPSQIHLLFKLKREYDKTPFLFLVFSYLKNKELQLSFKELRILRYEEKGSWSAFTFTKK